MPNLPSNPVMHTQLRMISMESRWVYSWDVESQSWKVVSSDDEVTEKFNAWATNNNANPTTFSLVPSHHYSDDNRTLTVIHTLAVSVIDRKLQAELELMYRKQTAQIVAAISPAVVSPATEKPIAPEATTSPTPVAPGIPAPSAPAPIPAAVPGPLTAPVLPASPTPVPAAASNPLVPVDVSALGEPRVADPTNPQVQL